MSLQRVVKPKNQRTKRALDKRQPKIHENDKQAMFIKGGRTSDKITQVLKDLFALKKPLGISYKKKNIARPFEDQTTIEFFADKSDASLFLFGSHSKKRPNNLVLGRLYDGHILDMFELGVERFKGMTEFSSSKCALGTKPCLVFHGETFDRDQEYQRLKNMFIDFFRGPVVTNIRLSGLEHVLLFTAADGKILIRSYKIMLKKSGHRIPRTELEEIGPSLDLTVRRTKIAAADLFKIARKRPKEAKPKKVKNVSRDAFGSKLAKIHMTKQDISKLQVRKMKGLKKTTKETAKKTENNEVKDVSDQMDTN